MRPQKKNQSNYGEKSYREKKPQGFTSLVSPFKAGQEKGMSGWGEGGVCDMNCECGEEEDIKPTDVSCSLELR